MQHNSRSCVPNAKNILIKFLVTTETVVTEAVTATASSDTTEEMTTLSQSDDSGKFIYLVF